MEHSDRIVMALCKEMERMEWDLYSKESKIETLEERLKVAEDALRVANEKIKELEF